MTTVFRLWITGISVAAVCGLVPSSDGFQADKKRDLQIIVKRIAAEIKNGNADEAKKMALAAAKDIDEVADLMRLYRNREKGGLGWGSMPGDNPQRDGIDLWLRDLARDRPAKYGKNDEEAAYWIAAMAEITSAIPKFSNVEETQSKWNEGAKRQRLAAAEFVKQLNARKPSAMDRGVRALYDSCLFCHLHYNER